MRLNPAVSGPGKQVAQLMVYFRGRNGRGSSTWKRNLEGHFGRDLEEKFAAAQRLYGLVPIHRLREICDRA